MQATYVSKSGGRPYGTPLKRQDTMLVVADHMVPLKRHTTVLARVVVDNMVPLLMRVTTLEARLDRTA